MRSIRWQTWFCTREENDNSCDLIDSPVHHSRVHHTKLAHTECSLSYLAWDSSLRQIQFMTINESTQSRLLMTCLAFTKSPFWSLQFALFLNMSETCFFISGWQSPLIHTWEKLMVIERIARSQLRSRIVWHLFRCVGVMSSYPWITLAKFLIGLPQTNHIRPEQRFYVHEWQEITS